MDRGVGGKLVDEADFQVLAALDAQHGSWNRAVIAAVAGADDPKSIRLAMSRGRANQRQSGGKAGARDDPASGDGKRLHQHCT